MLKETSCSRPCSSPQDNRYFFNRELLYFLQQLRLDILIDTIVVFIKIVSFVSCEKRKIKRKICLIRPSDS